MDEHHGHGDHGAAPAHAAPPAAHAGAHATELNGPELDRLARRATTHCLTGCAIGEVLGAAIGGAIGLSVGATLVLAIALAFVFGYSLTIWPLLAAGTSLRAAMGLAFAADTISITIMEAVDNATILLVPGAMESGVDHWLFWAALAAGFAIAWVVTYPVNRWLIARGRGHAVVHGTH